MQNRAFSNFFLNWTLLKARFDGEKLNLQHWHGQTHRLRERERRQNFERVCKFDFMPSASAAASACMYVSAAPWCPCTFHTYMHIYTREFANVVGHVCVSLCTWMCLSVVCECLTAITHVALLRLVTESTFVREQRQQRAPPAAKRDTAQNAGSFFSLLSFFL